MQCVSEVSVQNVYPIFKDQEIFFVWIRGGRDSSVIVDARYGLEGPEFESCLGSGFP
jgi:hypothetical protein